jgi:mono/diheme cytochrome c family protein
MRKCVGVLVIAPLVLASDAALAEDQAQIDAGAEVYQSKCAECHGERLVNTGAAFDLRKLHADERSRFNKSVIYGKGQMPSWQGMLTDEEMDELWAYIRSKMDD